MKLRFCPAALLMVFTISFCFAQKPPSPPPPLLASIGDFKLESGASILDCKIAYRTFGTLNSAKNNAILVTTWFTGNTGALIGSTGAGKMYDSSKYYVIAVDALGDGFSSSPSNSTRQPGMRFPQFTIRDMVNSQHQLLTKVLKIDHLLAVTGGSMGGMQTFQWVVSYPDFVDKAIPVMGTPRLTAYDTVLWNSEVHAIEKDPDWNHGDYTAPPPLRAVKDIHWLHLTTPRHEVANANYADTAALLNKVEAPSQFDANNYFRQLQAILTHDVSKPFGGSMERAAQSIKAQILIIASPQDLMVNSQPAIDFGKLINAPTILLDSDCGHLAPGCSGDRVALALADFLSQPPARPRRSVALEDNWQLVWSDEFEGAAGGVPDPAKWTPQVGGNGWGNAELEYYTSGNRNAKQANGMLTIEARQERTQAEDGSFHDYTSSRLQTKKKFAQQYGRFEARIKIPFGQGIWPAFWMLGDNIDAVGWPKSGEIDIMENIGREPGVVHGTIHGPGYSADKGIGSAFPLPAGEKFSSDFHVYAVEWEPNQIRFYVDAVLYATRTPADLPAGAVWVYDHPFFLLLNLAVGGYWPGYPDATTQFPQTMQVDYVRVYQRKPASPGTQK